jgi:hypothetical protein
VILIYKVNIGYEHKKLLNDCILPGIGIKAILKITIFKTALFWPDINFVQIPPSFCFKYIVLISISKSYIR